MNGPSSRNVAQLIVQCLEHEGVDFVFGIPGEENLHIIDALLDSSIRFITVRHEQGASFMADMYGALAGKAAVCLATLGPGAINLALGIANAQLDGHPLVAIVAQAGLDRTYRESHQVVDLGALFKPITKWVVTLNEPRSVAEVIRKAFKTAQSERAGSTVVILPEDVGSLPTPAAERPLIANQLQDSTPNGRQIERAARAVASAKNPIVLAGPGTSRDRACASLLQFSEHLDIPVATTFSGKGVFPEDHRNSIGAVGFMLHDYGNFAFDDADLVIAVGYDLIEYSPARWNTQRDKQIIHIHRLAAEVDGCYELTVGIEGNIAATLEALSRCCEPRTGRDRLTVERVRAQRMAELAAGRQDASFPLKPQRIVSDIRAAVGLDDIVLSDTGAQKMWMARLFPCYRPGTFVISNGLATMAFSLPGALGAKLARPQARVLASMGDGSFLMNSQELETAVRERIHFVVLVWVDGEYGLIKWKQELELGRSGYVKFGNPDFLLQAESYGAQGVRIKAANELLPALERALSFDGITIIECPVDYSENLKLSSRLLAASSTKLSDGPSVS
ncbi:MAG: acetolactate synthase large subunit [Planctomycetes bacterium]|nr:acetolactate synthase large subunit [Planctomycetota bacterium]